MSNVSMKEILKLKEGEIIRLDNNIAIGLTKVLDFGYIAVGELFSDRANLYSLELAHKNPNAVAFMIEKDYGIKTVN